MIDDSKEPEDLQKKLLLVTTEITSKGKDPSAFTDWLETQKKTGKDLSQWSLDELTKMIAAYNSLYAAARSRKDTEESEEDSSEEASEKPSETEHALEVSMLEGGDKLIQKVVIEK